MGRSICRAVAPFKITGVGFGCDLEVDHDILNEVENTIEQTLEIDWNFKGTKPVHGWDVHIDAITYPQAGARNHVYPHKITKGEFTVFLVNEHEWSDGGGISFSVFADDRASLEEIANDWGFNSAGIEENAPLIQVC